MTRTVTGAPYFTATAKNPKQYPYLGEDLNCEVVVVGGGVAGALCAYSLQQAGVDTVLADAALFGFGSTAAASSILTYDFDYNLTGLKKLIGLEKAVDSYRACARGLDELEKTAKDLGANVGFSRRDSFYYTPCELGIDAVRQEYLLRRHHEFPVEFLDAARAAERFSFRVEAGIYSSGLAGEIDPYRLTHALIAEAELLGMRAYENTSIETVTPDFEGITLTTDSGHAIRAKKMVNATGLSALRGTHVAQPRTTFCVVTAPVDGFSGWHNRCIIRDDGDPYLYLRTLPDDRILIGGLDSRALDIAGVFAGLVRIPAAVSRKYDQLLQKLTAMMTGIDEIHAEYCFSSSSGDTGDGLPYIGTRPGYPNVFYDICTGSNGIVFAQLGADLIRDLYLGGDATDIDLFTFGRL